MNFNYPIADLVSRINTCNRHRVKTGIFGLNKTILAIVMLLLDLGLIRGFRILENKTIRIHFRFRGGFQIFYKVNVVSKPSSRVYWDLRKLYLNVDKNSSAIYVLSTKKGLLIGSDCLWQKVTGEVLFKILL